MYVLRISIIEQPAYCDVWPHDWRPDRSYVGSCF